MEESNDEVWFLKRVGNLFVSVSLQGSTAVVKVHTPRDSGGGGTKSTGYTQVPVDIFDAVMKYLRSYFSPGKGYDLIKDGSHGLRVHWLNCGSCMWTLNSIRPDGRDHRFIMPPLERPLSEYKAKDISQALWVDYQEMMHPKR